VVGSFPQPEWTRTAAVGGVRGSRARRSGGYRKTSAIRPTTTRPGLVVREWSGAGVDIVSDGEVRRESYFSWLAPALTGLDVAKPGTATSRTGRPTPVPRAVARSTRPTPCSRATRPFLRGETSHPIRSPWPGPFTLTALTQNEYYPDAPSLAMAYAAVGQRRAARTSRRPAPTSSSLTSRTCKRGPIWRASFGVAVIDRA